jgi:hypothetical protein
MAAVFPLEIGAEILDIVKALMPLLNRDLVHRSDVLDSLSTQAGNEMPSDESTCTRHDSPAHPSPPPDPFAVERP